MKKLLFLAVIISMSAAGSISCQSTTQDTTVTQEERQVPPNGDRKVPPPGDRRGPPPGDRKGPPRGGSPEQTKTLEEIGGYQIGDVASDFSLPNIDGNKFSLSGIENAKGYIVTFTCNECPFAKMYEDRLIDLHNTYAPKGYSVVAINPNNPENSAEGFEAMQARAKEKGFPFPYLVDEGQEVYPKYGAVRTPHVFLLDSKLKVQYIGTIDDNARSAERVKVKYIENAIEALENGSKPDPNFTKAIGCPIKA